VNYLSVEQVSKSFGDRELFRNLSFGLARGEKAALVARNGSGKSTLLNIITGREPADSGQAVFRKDIIWTYVDQQSKLEEQRSILENVVSGQTPLLLAIVQYEQALLEQQHDYSEAAAGRLQAATDAMNRLEAWDLEQRIKEILSKLQITDLNQPVGTLSGGQRKRVALAKLMKNRCNLLILDEPTNDLDLVTLQVLESALERFEGVVLTVTHDRFFLNRVATSILAFEGDGRVVKYEGDYDIYRRVKAQNAERQKVEEKARQEAEAARLKRSQPTEPEPIRKRPVKLSFQEQKELEQLPGRIEAAETEQAELQLRLSDPTLYAQPQQVRSIQTRLGELDVQLPQLYARWELLEEKRGG